VVGQFQEAITKYSEGNTSQDKRNGRRAEKYHQDGKTTNGTGSSNW
jgi:hypothetical protein